MSNDTIAILALAGTILVGNWAGYHRLIAELDLGPGAIQAAHLAAGMERLGV